MVPPNNDHEAVLATMLEEIYHCLQAGQQVDLAEYASKYPAYLDELQRLLPTLRDLAAWYAAQVPAQKTDAE